MKWKRSKKAAVEARQKDDSGDTDKNKKDNPNVSAATTEGDKMNSLDTSANKEQEHCSEDMNAENIDVTEVDEDFDHDDDDEGDMSESDSVSRGVTPPCEGVNPHDDDANEQGVVPGLQFHGTTDSLRSVVEPSHGWWQSSRPD